MKSLLSKLGPGLLYAGAAVGVSHLVQSTRAGANYGLIMLVVVLLSNIIKYPFFKAGPLYAAKTGKSLVQAFYDLGPWAMAIFYGITLGTMFAVQAAITLICASVISSIFQINLPLWQISSGLLVLCFVILIGGRFSRLNQIMKYVIILLSLTTLVALFSAMAKSQVPQFDSINFSFAEPLDVLFLIALVGWMPAPLDISLWHSEWTLADAEDEKQELDVTKSMFDFKVGYWGTTFLAMAFVALGSLILKGSGEALPDSGTAFAGQIIGMYTATLGQWAFVVVSLAAFTTMFSTTLTVLDAFPRVLSKAFILSFPRLEKSKLRLYPFLLLTLILGSIFVLVFQMENMRQMVDLATSISFLTAPVLALMIWHVLRKEKAAYAHFSTANRVLAILGIVFLLCFSSYYLYLKFS